MISGYASPEQAADSKLARMGRRLVSMEMIGQDPSEGRVTFVVVAELIGLDRPDRFSVHIFRDWTISDSASLGYTFGQGYYGYDYGEAMEVMGSMVAERLRTYAWVYPGTDVPIGRRS